MKKRFLVSLMSMTLVAGALAGCGSKTEPVQTSEATVAETSAEKSVEEKTEATVEEKADEAAEGKTGFHFPAEPSD